MKVKELLSSPDKWTQNAYARDAHGRSINEQNESAVCYCIRGAIFKCYGVTRQAAEIQGKLSMALIELYNSSSAFEWNDTPGRKFEEVKELVDKLDI